MASVAQNTPREVCVPRNVFSIMFTEVLEVFNNERVMCIWKSNYMYSNKEMHLSVLFIRETRNARRIVAEREKKGKPRGVRAYPPTDKRPLRQRER